MIHLISSGCLVDVAEHAISLFPEDIATMQNLIPLACLVVSVSDHDPFQQRFFNQLHDFWRKYLHSLDMSNANQVKACIDIHPLSHKEVLTKGEQSIPLTFEQFSNVLCHSDIPVHPQFFLVTVASLLISAKLANERKTNESQDVRLVCVVSATSDKRRHYPEIHPIWD
jgi:hypothetical protein